ncbi:hypothetical protein ACHAXT_007919 [Thalassiosira profunda]
MGMKSAILLAGVATAAAAGRAEQRPQAQERKPSNSRFLRNRKKAATKRGRLTNRTLKKHGRHDVDITAEDVGFWTRTLQGGSLPAPTPFPTPRPQSTPEPQTPNPTDGFEPTPAPTTVEPTFEPTEGPSFPCNLEPEERAAQIRELLGTVSDPALFDDPATPQAQALDWITNEDTIEPVLCPNEIGEGCTRGGSVNPLVQRYALAVFYYGTDGDDWEQCSAPDDFSDPASIAVADAACERVVTPFGVANERVGDTSTDAWLGPVNECFWGGVACWGSDTPNLNLCIDQLDFENDGLSGSLVEEVSVLDTLRFLILEQGTISGPIPASYGDLERLLILDMDFNDLSGSIPDEIYGLRSLQQLDLNDNEITGSISPSIGDLEFLTFFQIDHNLLSGTIPTEMGELDNLRIAFLSVNDLTGTMPEEVCALRNNTSPPGVLGVLVTDCAGDPPEVECPCCSSCA